MIPWLRKLVARLKVRRKTFGKNNQIRLEGIAPEKFHFYLCGNDNSIQVGRQVAAGRLSITIRGSGNELTIGNNCVLESCTIEIWAKDSKIHLGESCRIMGASLIIAESKTSIMMGNGCLVATGVEVRTGDGHAVYDRTTGERLNTGRSVSIGNNVWIAKNANLLKGATIPAGSIVAAGAIVSKSFTEENALYAGLPAVLKRNQIRWEYSLSESGGRVPEK